MSLARGKSGSPYPHRTLLRVAPVYRGGLYSASFLLSPLLQLPTRASLFTFSKALSLSPTALLVFLRTDRKRNASKLPAESPMRENMKPSLGKSEPSPAREEEKGKSELEQKSTSRGRRKSEYYPTSLRRSQRKTPALVTSDHDIETNVEDIIVSENANDKTDTQMEKVWSEPDADLGEQSLKEKVEYILQRLEALEKVIESLHAKVGENIDLGKTPPSASAVHRMYTDSQKQLEASREENRQLTGKLENALGKVEVLEKHSDVLVELLEKWKDVVMISNLSKGTEAAVNASVQAIQNACATYGGKRKRHA